MTLIEFEIFARSVADTVTRRAAAITGDAEVAADLRQDTLLRLWTMRTRLDDYQHPEALAVVIVTRLAFNHLRQQGRRPAVSIHTVSEAALAGEEPEVGPGDVDEILSQLPQRQQMLLRMRHVDGLEIDQMARALNSSNGAIRTALSRARRAAFEIFSSTN